MKKSLSVILSTAMALSVFSSVAFGATSADFDDLKDLDAATKAKFDKMIEAGIFEGMAEGNFGLTDNMNRAQFAKVAAMIFELEVDEDLTESSFEDVSIEDEENGKWALPFIEAVKEAGITDGTGENTFSPADDVSKEMLATMLIRGLGKDAEAQATPGVDDTTVSDWAKSYVAYAIESGVVANGTDGTFGGTSAATRELLVIAAYGAQEAYEPPVDENAKLSVSEAKATGVQKVEVKFNKPADDTKATLALTKGSTPVATKTTWSEDKKTATLALTSAKITEGSYTVTLTGVEAETTTGTFTAENETVKKIDFSNPSETVAYDANVRIDVKAYNQYDELASFPAANYTLYGSNATLSKNDDGTLVVKVNTTSYAQNYGAFPLSIRYNESGIVTSKTFKVGIAPFVATIQSGDVQYTNNKTTLTTAGEVAYIPLTRLDQYGNEIVGTPAANSISVVQIPLDNKLTNSLVDRNSDGKQWVKLLVSALPDVSTKYTITVYGGGSNSSATSTVTVSPSKVPTKIAFGDITGTLAQGDKDKYIPIVAYDAENNQLTADEIVDNASKMSFSFSGFTLGATTDVPSTMLDSTNGAIVTKGEHKGKLHIAAVGNKGPASLYVTLNTGTQVAQNNLSFQIQDARFSDKLVLTSDSKDRILGLTGYGNASSEWKLEVKDQYGEEFSPNSVTDTVYFELNSTSNMALTVNGDTSFVTTGTPLQIDGVSGKSIKFWATGVTTPNQTMTVKATLKRNGTDVLNSITNEITTWNGTDKLTYSVDTIDTLWNARDNKIIETPVGDPDVAADALTGLHAREVKIVGKDNAGNTYALPAGIVQSVSSSNASVVYFNTSSANKVVGNKEGVATVTAVFKTADGMDTASKEVTVKSDAISIASVSVGNKTKSVASVTAGVYYANTWTGAIKAKDNFNTEYKLDGTNGATNTISDYNAEIGVRYYLTEVNTSDSGASTAAINATTGQVTIVGNGITSFVINVIAPSGKSASTTVVKQLP